MTRFATLCYVALLCLACLVGWLGVCGYLMATGNAPLWSNDGASQYLNFFVWEGAAIRDAVSAFLAGDGFSFPLYTYHIGYGSDTLVTMSNVVGKPLNLLSALCPPQYALYLFLALVVVRIMLAALAFSYYCLRRGNSKSASFVGSLCYAFSGYFVFLSVLRHPFFLTAAILFPLILAGADSVFEKKFSVLFVAAMAVQFFTSVYCAYMASLVLLAYCMVKYFFAPRKRSAKDYFALVGAFAGQIALSFCIAGIMALPLVLSLMSNERVGMERAVANLFEFGRYVTYPAALVGGYVATRGVYVGAVALSLVSVFVVAPARFDKSVRRPWLVGLVLVVICMVFPQFSRMLNGFSYPTDRWMFALAFCVSYIVCLTVPVLRSLNARERRRALVLCLVLAAASAVSVILYPTSVVVMTVFFIAVACFVLSARGAARLGQRALTGSLGALILVGVCAAATLSYMPGGWGPTSEYESAETLNAWVGTEDNPSTLVPTSEDGQAYRASLPRRFGTMKNASLNHDAMLIDFYSSMYNPVVDAYRTSLGITDEYYNFRFSGNDGRSAIDLFSGARYYVWGDYDYWRVPYSYDPTGVEQGDKRLSETTHALPLAFSTRKVMPRSEYDALSMAQRQEALLQACVLEDNVLATQDGTLGLEATAPTLSATEIPYDVDFGGTGSIEEGAFTALSDDFHVDIAFQGAADCETYLVFENLRYDDYNPSQRALAKGQDASGLSTWIADRRYVDALITNVTVSGNGHDRMLTFANPNAPQYGGKHDWVFNLGYNEDPMDAMTVSFSGIGRYSFDAMKVVCQPVEPIVEHADALATGAASSLQLLQNRMQAAFEGSGLGVFSIPFSEGWRAWVDGEEVDILRADVGFMAVPLEGEGAHDVSLVYTTPGLFTGALLSVLGVVVLCGIVVLRRVLARRGQAAKSIRESA